MKLRVWMSEKVFYHLVVEVDDDATDEDIAKAAEEQFVQGDYHFDSCADRTVDDWETIKEQPKL